MDKNDVIESVENEEITEIRVEDTQESPADEERSNVLIDCDGLVKIYKTDDLEVMALQGLDLTIEKGELIAIIGKSGSGKSTLLNIIGGLERPSAGRITFDGISLSELTERQMMEYREKRVGFVWQKSAENLLPYLTAVQNVEMPLMFSRLSKKQKREKAMEMLRQVGMDHRADSYPRMLSGGEQQRVAIALSLMQDPDLILADEPTGAVDSKTSAMIQDLFRKLNREKGVTVIIVTHDISLANKVDRVVMISDGKISSERVIKDAYKERIDALSRRSVEEIAEGALFADGQDEASTPTGETAKEMAEKGTEETHEEYVIMDRAGRLQLSKELREQVGIDGNRVKLEVVDGKIVISKD
ncbi:MAG: ABC transporter ATP-binding protein [Eubacterium sp.]|nr:ABC transporter ATP-binding protein [Eubacterium sp.]